MPPPGGWGKPGAGCQEAANHPPPPPPHPTPPPPTHPQPVAPRPCQVSALRFLSRQGIVNCDFLVGTTAMCTGSSLLAGLLAQGASGPGAQLGSAEA